MSSELNLADEIAVGKLVTRKYLLTNAQIKALRATPFELVPGIAGKLITFVSAQLQLNYGGTNVFTESAANFVVRYTNTTGAIVSQVIENTGFIDQSANTVTNGLGKIDSIVTKAASQGQGLFLHNNGAGEIAGNAAADNTLSIAVSFIVNEF